MDIGKLLDVLMDSRYQMEIWYDDGQSTVNIQRAYIQTVDVVADQDGEYKTIGQKKVLVLE